MPLFSKPFDLQLGHNMMHQAVFTKSEGTVSCSDLSDGAFMI